MFRFKLVCYVMLWLKVHIIFQQQINDKSNKIIAIIILTKYIEIENISNNQ